MAAKYLSIAGQNVCADGELLKNTAGVKKFETPTPCLPFLLFLKLEPSLSEKNEKKLLYHFQTQEISYQTQSFFYKTENGWFLRMEKENSQDLLMEISPSENGTFTALLSSNEPAGMRFAFWLAFNIACLHRKTAALHASAISYNGKSVLFLGESGTGKSTHTRLWLENIPGSELLNDDSPFLQINENQQISVWGSPWSGKTPCYKNLQTQIAAIVRLSQAPHNKIRRLSKAEAVGALLPSFPPALAYDENLSEKIYEIISCILQQIPIYHLECLPDATAAQLVFSALEFYKQ